MAFDDDYILNSSTGCFEKMYWRKKCKILCIYVTVVHVDLQRRFPCRNDDFSTSAWSPTVWKVKSLSQLKLRQTWHRQDISLNKCRLCGGARCKIRGSSKSVRFILSAHQYLNFMAVDLTAAEIHQSGLKWWIDHGTDSQTESVTVSIWNQSEIALQPSV